MTDKNIEKHVSDITVKNRKEPVKVWRKDKSESQDLLIEVRKLIDGDDSSHILSSFCLDHNCYTHYKLGFDKFFLVPPNKLPKLEFKVKDIKVHCFASGINFLELDYTVNPDNPEVINNFNYFITENHSRVRVSFIALKYDKETNKKTEIEMKNSLVLDWLLSLVEEIRPQNDSNSGKKMSENIKPLLFSYYFDSGNTKMDNNLGRNYKSSYNLNGEYLKKTNYFENSTWYYSNNNVSNVTHAVDDERNNSFFEETFPDKINKLYFPLVLLAYYLRLYYLHVYQKLFDMNISFSGEEELKDKINQLTVVKANFERICWLYCFDSPSYIEHVNLFYTNVLISFNVIGYKEMVSSKLNFLYSSLEDSFKLIVKSDEKKEEIRKNKYDMLSFIVGSAVSFASLHDTIIKLLLAICDKTCETCDKIVNIILFSFFVVILGIVICCKVKEIKKIKTEMKVIEEKLRLTNQPEITTS